MLSGKTNLFLRLRLLLQEYYKYFLALLYSLKPIKSWHKVGPSLINPQLSYLNQVTAFYSL